LVGCHAYITNIKYNQFCMTAYQNDFIMAKNHM
jgi:hypothetical protein